MLMQVHQFDHFCYLQRWIWIGVAQENSRSSPKLRALKKAGFGVLYGKDDLLTYLLALTLNAEKGFFQLYVQHDAWNVICGTQKENKKPGKENSLEIFTDEP